MGAEPWQYFVPFDKDIQRALDELKDREFQAGRFRYSEEDPQSIEEAREIADADGTASILDIDHIGDEADFGVVVPISNEQLIDLYGTDRPTHGDLESNQDFFEDIERGQGVYCLAYEGDKPAEIFFAGYSYD